MGNAVPRRRDELGEYTGGEDTAAAAAVREPSVLLPAGRLASLWADPSCRFVARTGVVQGEDLHIRGEDGGSMHHQPATATRNTSAGSFRQRGVFRFGG